MTTLAEKIAEKLVKEHHPNSLSQQARLYGKVLAALNEHAAPVEWAVGNTTGGCSVVGDVGAFNATIRHNGKDYEGSGPTVADACQQARERAEGKS